MRINNSIKNIYSGIIHQIVMILLAFISRKIFISSLGSEYLGINGLLDSVISMLGLIEAGIGASITYHLYKPLADNDKNKVISLVNLYKNAYRIIAIVVLVISVFIYPIVLKSSNGIESISNIIVVYFLFVLKNVIVYLFAYKISLINADQKGYIITNINTIVSVITTILKILILSITNNYILYLIIDIITLLIQNIVNSNIVNRIYPYINTKQSQTIDKETKQSIYKNVRAMFFGNIGSYCVFSTDNILIASFIDISTVGIYSNYTMITSKLSGLVSPILGGISESVGNLIATESSNKIYSIFKTTYLVNFWIHSWCVIFLYNLLNPFIIWWLGSEYLLDSFTYIIILINFYITGLRSSIATFKNKAGIFVQDQYMPIIESIINLGSSLILVKYLGLGGIFLGTTISTISIVFWNVPRLTYKYVFNKSVKSYFIKYTYYTMLMIITGFITTKVCETLVIGNQFIDLVLKGIICLIVPNSIYLSLFYKTDEFKYILGVVQKLNPYSSLLINKVRINLNK